MTTVNQESKQERNLMMTIFTEGKEMVKKLRNEKQLFEKLGFEKTYQSKTGGIILQAEKRKYYLYVEQEKKQMIGGLYDEGKVFVIPMIGHAAFVKLYLNLGTRMIISEEQKRRKKEFKGIRKILFYATGK